MGAFSGSADSAAAAAVAATALLFGAVRLRRHGRFAGWQGQVDLAVLATGLGLAAFAFWPAPLALTALLPGGASAAPGAWCAAGGAPVLAEPFTRLGEGAGGGLRGAAAAFAVFLPFGVLARYRYRAGAVSAVLAGAAAACAVEAVQASGGFGALPCAMRTASVDDALLGAAGTLAGWLLGCAAVRLLPRGWPGASVDLLPPGLSRRAAGHLFDGALLWALPVLAAPVAAPLLGTGPGAARLGLVAAGAAVLGVLLPLLRDDRCTPCRAALMLAVTARAGGPAPRLRVLLRSALLYGPAALLVAVGQPWWIAAVAAVHGAPALFRRDGAGLADLIAGTRIATRAAISPVLPSLLVRSDVPLPPPPPPVPAQREGEPVG